MDTRASLRSLPGKLKVLTYPWLSFSFNVDLLDNVSLLVIALKIILQCIVIFIQENAQIYLIWNVSG